MILSIEAIGEEGYTYGLRKGQLNYFALVYRAVSLEDKIKHMITEGKDTVDQWVLDLSQTHRAKTARNLSISFIEHFLRRSNKDRLDVMYNTLFVNCTNELFRTMQETLPARPFNDADLIAVSVPIDAPRVLKGKHMISRQKGSKTELNDEILREDFRL